MRTHGWSGQPPASDDEARRLLVEAATRCVSRLGRRATLADVARQAGVTRATVYRYFDGPVPLFQAMSLAASDAYIEQLVAHVQDVMEPLDMAVEVFLYCLETLPAEPHVAFHYQSPAGTFAARTTSEPARSAATWLLQKLPVDWRALGHTPETLSELAELMLRLLQSFLLDPTSAPPTREVLRRWLAGAVRPSLSSDRDPETALR